MAPTGRTDATRVQPTGWGRWTAGWGVRYGLALVSVGVIWGLRTALDPQVGHLQPFSPFLLPVIFMGWWAGPGPALVSAVVGFSIADWFFAVPRGSILSGGAQEVTATVTFAVIAAACIIVTSRMRREHQRLEDTLNSISDAFFRLDRHGVLKGLNPAAEQLLGKNRRELLGSKLWDKFPESVGSRFHHQTEASLRDGRGASFEEFCEALKRWLEVHVFPTPQGGVALYLRDISERKKAEQALCRSEERLRLAVETAALGLYERDVKTNEVTLDLNCKRILGVENVPFGPDVLDRSLHQEDRERVLAMAARAYDPATQAVCAADFRIVQPGGQVHWVAGRGQVIFDDSTDPPSPLKFLAVLQDITERKQVEQDLAQIRTGLESLVAERTARLSETVGELEHFSYTITHDMRAPLRAMQGYSQMLQGQEPHLSERSRDFLRRIIASSQRMDLLITDALNYAKVVREQLRLEPVDAQRLLREMLESYPELQPHRADIQVLGPISPVQGNRAALTQCFSNLLNNAIKFVHPGVKPVVRIWSERRGDFVRIWFKDNGIGIPADQHEKIFLMFQRVSTEYEGTGIGLALVRKVVERMKGRVGVLSEEGQGSRFWVELPPAQVPAGRAFAA